MKRQHVMDTVLPLIRERENFRTIGLDDDYFEAGVSSLTIVGLQIQVEEKLGVTLETRTLMGFSTLNQWLDAYSAKLESTTSPA